MRTHPAGNARVRFVEKKSPRSAGTSELEAAVHVCTFLLGTLARVNRGSALSPFLCLFVGEFERLPL